MSLSLSGLPRLERSVVRLVLNVASIQNQPTAGPHRLELVSLPLCETPLTTHVDLLATRELEFGATKSLDDLILVSVLRAHREDYLPDINPRHSALRLAKRSTHSCLEPVGSSTRQHLVDSDDVERMESHSHVERILAGKLHQVLVGADATGLECLRRYLFPLIRDKVHAERKLIDLRLLPAEIKDTNLGIWHSSTEARLGIRLVLAIAIASRWTSTHCYGF